MSDKLFAWQGEIAVDGAYAEFRIRALRKQRGFFSASSRALGRVWECGPEQRSCGLDGCNPESFGLISKHRGAPIAQMDRAAVS